MLSKRDTSLCKDVVLKIENGVFNESDMVHILITLREHVDNDSLFKELAHFIAHEQRDSGITFKRIYKLKCQAQALMNYQVGENVGRAVRLYEGEDIEAWLYDYLMFQFSDIEYKKLNSIGFKNRTEAERFFRGYFEKNNKNVKLIKYADIKLQSLIKALSSFIKIEPLFTQDKIMADFVRYFRKFKLLSNEHALRQQQGKIMLAILALLHKKEIYLNGKILGCLQVNSGVFSKNFDIHKDSGVLELIGLIYAESGPNIGMPMLQTNLLFQDNCNDNLAKKVDYGEDVKLDVYDFNCDVDIRLDENYRLTAID